MGVKVMCCVLCLLLVRVWSFLSLVMVCLGLSEEIIMSFDVGFMNVWYRLC